MTRFRKMAGAAAAIAALLLVAPSSEAQVSKKQSARATKLNEATKTNLPQATRKLHRLILQVNSNEPAMMNLALNNASNVVQYYKDLGEKVSIEVVTFGPGLHMLRDDTSPVKARIRGACAEQPGNLLQSLRQYPRKYEQGRKQGDSSDFGSEGCEVRRCARVGTAGTGLDLRQAVKHRARDT